MLITFNSRANKREKKIKQPEHLTTIPNSPLCDPKEADTLAMSPVIPKPRTPPNVKVIVSSNDFYRFKDTCRSKNGCLTCKIRKKKCDETRPVCSDCQRLKKKCTWVDYETMTEEEIKKLKESVEREESQRKLRKRKSKEKPNSPDKRKRHDSDTGDPLTAFGYDAAPDEKKTATADSPTLLSLMSPGEIKNEHNGYHSPSSPSAFLNLLREISGSQSPNQLIPTGKKCGEIEDYSGLDFQHLVTSPSFASFVESLDRTSSTYANLISDSNTFLTPLPASPPSYIPELKDSTCSYLYNYYVEVLSKLVSIAPSSQNDSNSYQKVFLPLAHRDKGVLYSILAWSGFHLGGHWSEEGTKFADYALRHIKLNEQDNDRQSILNKLATLLILCGAEICKGDVNNWPIYLNWGWKLLASNGGILKFNNSKEEHWLISNFAYHDLLASSSIERGTYFPSQDYDEIFKDRNGFSRGSLNPLVGISKKLYRIIGDICTLLYQSKKILREFYQLDSPPSDDSHHSPIEEEVLDDVDSDISDHGRASRLLQSVIEKVKLLEKEIEESKPEKQDLIDLTDQELELQLTLFEAFQLSSKLFLRQSIMKCNPSMLESQVLNNDLIKCLDILVGTSVQASLVFPIFISGIHCVSKHSREVMSARIEEYMKLYGMWNVSRVKFLMERIWEENPTGNQVVDWHNLLKEFGWDLNFA
ncbi:uncharacterized protein SPAPADRAFT_64973 [Spathaspora passalidarum NRRL Y-27907]|uniref:Zn(2)-C6 fungal-type domain-containing protein n=1 Tax=Spathaspora passalidarum (strain NRRL Y-27907 / 11-Y1) TaxID=619300 RepID=G3AIM8_SPAPN|nr:uncharacterized protein SPAPADRAFT_64973 [Spathaspora passalidarum NRRL Y-27907]EGW33743.1 hypothetical protein SPAPADRAFT_64973 [Spathaspora passalidarum NRRL Y-27907]